MSDPNDFLKGYLEGLEDVQKVGEKLLPQANSIDEVLNFDALDHAFKEAGEGKEGQALGMLLHLGSTKRKEEMLQGLNDTFFSMTAEDYIARIEEIGFKKVLEIPFHCCHCGTERDDTFYVFWHEDGILLRMDTYDGQRNSADIYFNYLPNDQNDLWKGTSGCSGGFSGEDNHLFFTGHRDAREAVKHNIQTMRAHGKFLKPWKKQGLLWLLHYGDTNGKQYGEYDYEAIRNERIAMLPKEIQETIKGE